jgi:hypothetical protein
MTLGSRPVVRRFSHIRRALRASRTKLRRAQARRSACREKSPTPHGKEAAPVVGAASASFNPYAAFCIASTDAASAFGCSA